MQASQGNEHIQKMVEDLKRLSQDDKIRRAALKRESDLQIENSFRKAELALRWEEGKAEGKAEGRAQERALVAIGMLESGIAHDTICKVLKISDTELATILAAASATKVG